MLETRTDLWEGSRAAVSVAMSGQFYWWRQPHHMSKACQRGQAQALELIMTGE